MHVFWVRVLLPGLVKSSYLDRTFFITSRTYREGCRNKWKSWKIWVMNLAFWEHFQFKNNNSFYCDVLLKTTHWYQNHIIKIMLWSTTDKYIILKSFMYDFSFCKWIQTSQHSTVLSNYPIHNFSKMMHIYCGPLIINQNMITKQNTHSQRYFQKPKGWGSF